MQHLHHSIDPCNELQQKLFFQCSKKYNFPHLYRVDISSAQFTSLTLSTLRGIISAFRVVYLFRVTSPFPKSFPLYFCLPIYHIRYHYTTIIIDINVGRCVGDFDRLLP